MSIKSVEQIVEEEKSRYPYVGKYKYSGGNILVLFVAKGSGIVIEFDAADIDFCVELNRYYEHFAEAQFKPVDAVVTFSK